MTKKERGRGKRYLVLGVLYALCQSLAVLLEHSLDICRLLTCTNTFYPPAISYYPVQIVTQFNIILSTITPLTFCSSRARLSILVLVWFALVNWLFAFGKP
jgi:hypothetical protein